MTNPHTANLPPLPGDKSESIAQQQAEVPTPAADISLVAQLKQRKKIRENLPPSKPAVRRQQYPGMPK